MDKCDAKNKDIKQIWVLFFKKRSRVKGKKQPPGVTSSANTTQANTPNGGRAF